MPMKLFFTLLLTAFVGANVVVLRPPLGLYMYMPVPEANPLTHDKVLLGRKLFFDKRLSRDGTLACANCHNPQLGFSDGRAVARGINGAEGTRNAPALINRGYGRLFFWDGRAQSLEQQALQPMAGGRHRNKSVIRQARPADETESVLLSDFVQHMAGGCPVTTARNE